MQGQPVVRLDDVAAVAARDRIGADLAAAGLDMAGLSALRDALLHPGRGVGFRPPPGLSPAAVADEYATIGARYGEQQARLADLSQQIAEKRVEGLENASAVDKLRAELPMLASTRDMYRGLNSEGLASRVDLLASEQSFSDTAHDLATQLEHAGEANSQAAALAGQYDAQRADYAHAVLQDLSQAEQKLGEDVAQFRAASHDAAATVLRAPVTGTVQQLSIHSVHGVVTPAQTLMVIVPDGGGLVVEAMVANRDIGFVHTGQRAKIKVAAFSFTRYGLILGRVIGVSRDAIDDTPKDTQDQRPGAARDEGGEVAETQDVDGGQGSGYVARIALDRDTIAVSGGQARLEPGMSVTAEILTGRRRVISYLLSPVMRHLQDAGRER